MKKVPKITALCLFFILVLITINLEIQNPILKTVKTLLVVLIAIFVPGYFLTRLILDKKTEKVEFLVISVAVSICFVILTAVLINYIGFSIKASNILNPLVFISFILTLVLILTKKEPHKFRKKAKNIDETFYLNLSFMLISLLSLAYLSINSTSNEQFVGLSWNFVKIESPFTKTDAKCQKINCSLSGLNKIERAKIGDVEYDVLFLDINQPGKYDSICIDLNQNNLYCESGEGPFWQSEGFVINNDAFSYNILDDGVVIFSFPKKLVDRTDFEVSYLVESHYSKTSLFDINLTVDGKVFSQKEISIEPGQQMIIKDNVSIPKEEGVHKVEVVVSPKRSDEFAKINFFVEYSIGF